MIEALFILLILPIALVILCLFFLKIGTVLIIIYLVYLLITHSSLFRVLLGGWA